MGVCMRRILLSVAFSLITANLYAACEVTGCNGEVCRAAGDNKFIFTTVYGKQNISVTLAMANARKTQMAFVAGSKRRSCRSALSMRRVKW